MHLLKHLGLQILDNAHQFDAIIDQLADDYHLQSHAPISLQNIPTNLPSLSVEHIAQLALVQIRSLPIDSGLDLLAMSEATFPAYYAAHLHHRRQLPSLQEGVPGPNLLPVLLQNASSSLFSTSFFQAQDKFTLRKAAPVLAETDIHPPLLLPDSTSA